MALNTNLKVYYKFDESSGDAADSTGNGNTAVNTSVTYSSGKKNNCAVYNGSAYHTISDSSYIKPTNAISISLWVNISSTSNYQMLLAKGENAGDTRSYEVRCYGTTTQLEMQLRAGGGSYINFRSTTALTTGVWYHVVFTRTGTTNKIYINGIEDTLAANTTNAGNIDYNTDSLWIGQRNGAYRFNGKIDELGLFDAAISNDEAKQIFNSGRVNDYPLTDTPSLYGGVAYYKFDESSGDAADSIQNNTLVNTSCTYATGKINNGVSFGTKMLSSLLPNLSSGDWIFNIWYKSSTTGTNKVIALFGNSAQSTNTIMYLYTTTGNAFALDTAGANIITSSNTSSLDGNWHMLTVTKSGDNFTMYIDNVSVGTGTRSGITLGTNLLSIGYDNPNSRWPWVGMLDECLITNRLFSSTEITTLYNGSAGLQWPWVVASTFMPKQNAIPQGAVKRASYY